MVISLGLFRCEALQAFEVPLRARAGLEEGSHAARAKVRLAVRSQATAGWPASWVVAGLAAGLALACSRGPDARVLAATAELEEQNIVPPPSAVQHEGLEGRWGWLEARPFGVLVPVPQATEWQVVARGRWFVARHLPSETTLAIRVSPARRTVAWDECQAELLVGQPELRAVPPGELIEGRDLSYPPGFMSRLQVWSSGLRGTALVVGAGPSRCFAAALRTHGSQQEVAQRLVLATEVLTQMRFLGLEEAHDPRRRLP